jgi:hypothetical protein
MGSLQLEPLVCVDGANQKKHGLFQSGKFETPVLKQALCVYTMASFKAKSAPQGT